MAVMRGMKYIEGHGSVAWGHEMKWHVHDFFGHVPRSDCSNDAWDGYGGAVVYSREPTLHEQYVPEIEKALARVGVRWADFTRTDNTCRAAETKLEEFEADFRFVETKVAGGIQVASNTLVEDVELGAELLKDETVALELEAERVERNVLDEFQRDLKSFFRLDRQRS